MNKLITQLEDELNHKFPIDEARINILVLEKEFITKYCQGNIAYADADMWNWKFNIVLSDEILKVFNQGEIRFVVYHEMGHIEEQLYSPSTIPPYQGKMYDSQWKSEYQADLFAYKNINDLSVITSFFSKSVELYKMSEYEMSTTHPSAYDRIKYLTKYRLLHNEEA